MRRLRGRNVSLRQIEHRLDQLGSGSVSKSTLGRYGPLDRLLPETTQELGASMRRLRGRNVSLRQIEHRLDQLGSGSVSKSTLGRYEKGQTLPPLEIAALLDDAYQARGWLLYAITHLWRRSWDPWKEEWPAFTHAHTWPASYGGMVWMDVRPTERDEGADHTLMLGWAPWKHRVEAVLPRRGVVLVTGKAPDHDGVARTLNLDADRRVYVLFGVGDVADDDGRVIDIRRGWTRAEPPSTEDSHGPARDAPGEEL